MTDDSENDFFKLSGTQSSQNFYFGQDIVDYFLGGCARSRMKHVLVTAGNLGDISNVIVGLDAKRQSLREEVEMHGESGPGGMFLQFDAIRKFTRWDLEENELMEKWNYWWADYLQQLEIIARHLLLVEDGHINHPKALEFADDWPGQMEMIAKHIDLYPLPESPEQQLLLLAQKHREYFQDVAKEKVHEDCEQDFHTIEFLSFIMNEVIPGGLRKQFPTDIDAQILERVHKLYYNKG